MPFLIGPGGGLVGPGGGLVGPDGLGTSPIMWRIEVDWNNDGDFADANEDVTQDFITAKGRHGRSYASNLAAAATAGTCDIVLKNWDGKYSTYNTSSPLYPLAQKTRRKIRIRIVSPVAFELWSGWTKIINPNSGSPPTVTLQCEGSFGILARTKIFASLVQYSFSGSAISQILTAAGWTEATSIDTGQIVISNFFADDVYALDALRDVEESELGFIREGRTWSVNYESRYHRVQGSNLVSNGVFTDTPALGTAYLRISQLDPTQEVFNQFAADVQPFVVGPVSVLWTYPDAPPVLGIGETRTFYAQYPGDTGANPTGAFVPSWITPDSTDIGITSGAFGLLTITTVKRSQTMDITIRNGNGQPVQLTIRARGTPATRTNAVKAQHDDTASQADFGVRSFPLGPWFSNLAYADEAGLYGLAQSAQTRPVVQIDLESYNDAVLANIVARDISDRITVQATKFLTMLGLNADFVIENVAFDIAARGPLRLSWQCSLANSDPGYWKLGTSALGTTTKLAF